MNFELQRLWLQTAATVLFVTHDIGEAIMLSDRVLVMSARPGRIVSEISVPLDRPRAVDSCYDPRFVACPRKFTAPFMLRHSLVMCRRRGR
jgi:NitT/TauT family transport system ATP-binding protein